jgi:hypothetical protein
MPLSSSQRQTRVSPTGISSVFLFLGLHQIDASVTIPAASGDPQRSLIPKTGGEVVHVLRFRLRYWFAAMLVVAAVGAVGVGMALGGNSATPPPKPDATAVVNVPTSAGCILPFCYYFDTFTTNAFSQSFGGIFCPSQSWHDSGGGAFGFSSSTLQNINSSYPIDSGADTDGVPDDGWGVYMNNGTGGALGFRAWVVCKLPTSLLVP